jgi:hypothetical protein
MAEKYGDPLAQEIALRIAPPTATTTTLAAIASGDRVDGMRCIVLADSSEWVFDADSSAGASSTVVAPDVGTGRWLKAADPSGSGIAKKTATITHANLTTSSTTETENIGTALPANARILGTNIKLTTPFSGGSVSALVVDIGSSGDPDALVDGADVFSAAVDGQASTRPLGIAPNKHFSTSTQLTALFTATDDDVVNLSAGSVTIEVYYVVLA